LITTIKTIFPALLKLPSSFIYSSTISKRTISQEKIRKVIEISRFTHLHKKPIQQRRQQQLFSTTPSCRSSQLLFLMNGLHNQQNKEEEQKEITGRGINQSISPPELLISKQKMTNGFQTNNESNKLSQSDAAKKAAAFACGEAEVRNGMDIGVGSGTTMKFFIDWLNEKQRNGQIKDVRCVATSFQVYFIFF
jgi:hypothetical protein